MKLSQQFILFTAVGGIGTAAHYAVLILLVQVVDLYPVVATTIGFVVGAIVNYVLNYCLTFSSSKRHTEALPKFLLVAFSGAVINTLIMMAGLNLFDIHYLIIQLVATGLVLLFNFMANRYWTFA